MTTPKSSKRDERSPLSNAGAVVTTDFAFETLNAVRATSSTISIEMAEPRGAGRPVGSPQPPPPPPPPNTAKKAILQKWLHVDKPAVTSTELDEEIYSIVSKPIERRRRFPKLLLFDANGVPISARSQQQLQRPTVVMKGPKRGRPRKTQVATLRRPRSDNAHVWRNELERVQQAAKTRMHIKMNLRGRRKLEMWLSSAKPFEKAALAFAVPKLAVDMRLLDDNEVVRRAALSNMPNADLRIVEALKLRCETKEGAVVWDYIGRQQTSTNDDGQTSVLMDAVEPATGMVTPKSFPSPLAPQMMVKTLVKPSPRPTTGPVVVNMARQFRRQDDSNSRMEMKPTTAPRMYNGENVTLSDGTSPRSTHDYTRNSGLMYGAINGRR